jgi:Ca2+-binding RTX toxin-like protein
LQLLAPTNISLEVLTSQDYESERNDWRTDADPIALGRTNEGQLSTAADVDWYRITPGQVGALDVSFTDHFSGGTYGTHEYKIEVMNDDGSLIESWGNVEYGSSFPFRIGVATTAAHFIKVSHDPATGAVDTGWYHLNVTQAPSDIDYESENNSTPSTAETMTLGRVIEGQLPTAADVDWYRITPSQIGALDVSFTDDFSGGSGGTHQYTIEVTDSSGTVLETWASTSWQGSDMRIGIANTAAHFIKVSHDLATGTVDTGWYHLNVTQAPSDIDYESENNGTRPLAETMTLGRVIEGQLSTAADVDWYRITPGQVGALDVSFTDDFSRGSGGTHQYTIEVTDSSGTVLETWANTSYQGSSKRIAVASTAERFIKVSHDPASGAVDTGWYHLTATSINFAPTLVQALPDLTLNEDVALNRVIPATTFADPGDTLVWSATLGDGSALPAWLRFNPTTRALTGRPGNAEVGRYEVKILATDAAGATGSDSFSLTVANLNDAPRLVLAAPDRSINEDAAFSFALPGGTFAEDDAGDALTYSARLAGAPTLPAWLTFDPRTLTFSGTPGNANVGTLDVRVVATDRSLASVSDDFRLTVVNVNDTPLTAARVLTTNEDSRLTFRLADFPFADEDAGDGLTKVKFLSWPVTGTLALAGQALGPFTEVSAADIAAGRLTYLPGTDVTGDVALNFAVSDGQVYSATAALTLRIAAVNDAPRLVAPLRDQVATTHAAFQFQIPTGAFADVEANPINYGATLADGTPLPGWLGFNPATGLFSGTPRAADAGRLDVQVTASDWLGASATDQFALQIDPEYGATTATAGSMAVGIPVTSLIDQAGDKDWFAVSLNAGVTYTLTVTGQAVGTRPALGDPYVRLFSAAGVLLGENDDGSPDSNDARLAFTPTAAAVYYVEAAGLASYSGGYRLLVAAASPNLITGGAGSDLLLGTPGADTLNGGAEADVMIGGDGSDLYRVDNIGDVVTETNAKTSIGGKDRVESILPSWTLGANVEQLTLVGTLAVNGTGNALSNLMTGNSLANSLSGGAGNDTLIGGSGADTLIGGLGNDTYGVDRATDRVSELVGEGTDTVEASVTFTLPAEVERLTLTGTTAINGTGNDLANILTGNAAANTLTGAVGNDTLMGGAGNDILVGGAGSDVLTGEAGADVFKFVTAGEGVDRLTDFQSATDKIRVVSANFGNLPLGVLAANRLVAAGTSLSSNLPVFVYTASTGALSFDSNGQVAGGLTQIATLTGAKTLVAGDLQVVAA